MLDLTGHKCRSQKNISCVHLFSNRDNVFSRQLLILKNHSFDNNILVLFSVPLCKYFILLQLKSVTFKSYVCGHDPWATCILLPAKNQISLHLSALWSGSCLSTTHRLSHTHFLARVQTKGWFSCATTHVNPFPHTTILQQTSLNIFCQKMENLCNWMDNLWLKAENIVSKGEIAHFEQFLLLSLCFQKAVCCRGVRKHLYGGKSYQRINLDM